jgi:hypothetical protein
LKEGVLLGNKAEHFRARAAVVCTLITIFSGIAAVLTKSQLLAPVVAVSGVLAVLLIFSVRSTALGSEDSLDNKQSEDENKER